MKTRARCKSCLARPKIDFVVSCAAVLATHCERNTELMASIADAMASPAGRGQCVPVDAELLHELIESVREMRQASKPLDADKQLSMLEE